MLGEDGEHTCAVATAAQAHVDHRVAAGVGDQPAGVGQREDGVRVGVEVRAPVRQPGPVGVEPALERLVLEDLGCRTRLTATSLVDSFEARDAFVSGGMEVGVREGYERQPLVR